MCWSGRRRRPEDSHAALEHSRSRTVTDGMRQVAFDQPVVVTLGAKFRRFADVAEATGCLKDSSWPRRGGPFWDMAARAMNGADAGFVTAAEAREAFADAALEAGVPVH